MTDAIKPFYRVSGEADAREGPHRLLRVMRWNFALAGLLALAASAGLVAYLYWLEFQTIDVKGLRITQAGRIYQTRTQLLFLLVILLALASLIEFQAARRVGMRGRGGLWVARLAALLLVAGLPLGVLLWSVTLDITGLSPGTVEQVQHLAAILLLAQALLAAAYLVILLLPGTRRTLSLRGAGRGRVVLHAAGVAVIGLAALALLGLAAALAVATDWIELPVSDPAPGELLFATSFDAFNDEWDLHGGRDSMRIEEWSAVHEGTGTPAASSLSGPVLVVRHGSPNAGEIVWSTLDRKVTDFDLRVTAQWIAGPEDNQYGVIFRYRDPENFYIFRVSSDGYYSLAKVRENTQVTISEWGTSEAIRLGDAPNDLRVVAQGDEFRFYINGTPLPLCFKGENKESMWNPAAPGECVTSAIAYVYQDGDFKQGRIALAAGTIDGSEVAVAFDDLALIGPDAQAMALPE